MPNYYYDHGSGNDRGAEEEQRVYVLKMTDKIDVNVYRQVKKYTKKKTKQKIDK